MKHRVWSLLAALALLVAACAFSVSAESAEPTCPHCGQALSAITWETWAGAAGDLNATGHYRLAADYQQGGQVKLTGGDVVVDLAGHTLSTTANRPFYVNGGTLSILDTSEGKTGLVTGKATASGAVLFVNGNGTLHIYGGTFESAATTGKDGGTVAINGTVTLHDGTIKGSTSTTAGGCLQLSKGSFTMNGGTLTAGTAATSGGTIFAKGGTLTLNGGTIEAGTVGSGKSGKAVFAYRAAEATPCTVNIGSVSVPYTGRNSFVIGTNTTVNLSGAPTIGYLSSSSALTLGKLTKGANVYLAITEATTLTAENTNLGKYLENGYIKSYAAGQTLTAADDQTITPVAYDCPCCDAEDITWHAWDGTMTDGNHYYLNQDLELEKVINVPTNTNITLDLHGHMISSATVRGFLVYGGLKLVDTGVTGQVLTGTDSTNGGVFSVQAGGNVELFGGNYTTVCAPSKGSVAYVIGSMTVHEGAVLDGSAVQNAAKTCGTVYTKGSFAMDGGTVIGSTAKQGGSIFVETGSLSITGGTVRGGTANLGGNIYAGNGAVVTINGGVIGGGHAVLDADAAQGNGGNLYVAEGAKAEVISGNIQNGKADSYGGNIAVAAGAELTVDSGYIRNGQANLGGKLVNFRGDNLYTEGTLTMKNGYIALSSTDMPGNAVLARGSAVVNIQGNGTYAAAMSGQVHLLSTCTLNADFGALIVNRYGRISWYKTLEEAIAAFGSNEDDRCVRMLYAQDITSDKDLYLDVNGLSLNVTLSEGAVLYGFDSSATLEAPGTGSVTLLGEGTVARDAENSTQIGRFIAITENGKTTFHRLKMEITKVTLRTDAAGFYYKAVYSCDPVLAALVRSYGVVLSVNNMPGADFMTETGDINIYTVKTDFVSGQEITSASVFGILKDGLTASSNQRRGEMKIYANAYICFDFDGQQETLLGDTDNGGLTADDQEFDGVAYSLYDIMAQLNESFAELDQEQQAQVAAFYAAWYQMGFDWYFGNIAPSFAVGFGRADITPDFNVYISGGNVPSRISTEVLDPIYITCVAITDDEGKTALIVSQDLLSADLGYSARQKISAETGIPFKNIMISATHTHSAPGTAGDYQGVAEYQKIYYAGALEAAKAALRDRAPATAQTGSTQARTDNNKQLVFVRRYKQLDGGYRGGVGNNTNSPLIGHAYEANETMQVIKFVREGKKDILFTNLGAHATFNGATTLTAITSDFPGAIREYVESNSDCLSIHFISGGADQNPTSELLWEEHGLNYKTYGQAVAKAALATTLSPVQTGKVQFSSKVLTLSSNKADADAETLAKAEEANAVFLAEGFAAGEAKAVELGFIGIYHARSILNHVNLEDTQSIGINALVIGEMSFVFAPYEMFGSSAAEIVAGSPYENTFVVSCANDAKGYVPTAAAYDMGCYESYTARVASGSAEALVAGFLTLLEDLAK